MDMNRAKVSCHIITYNQKDYISQCIEGVLMQQRNFPIEIIIGDDNSTDGTDEIVADYARKYPDLIKTNLRKVRGRGIPGKENFLTTLEMCTGEYISLCDGDDYWTDPLKLQKQVDFLDHNQDYVMHAGNAAIISQDPDSNGTHIHTDLEDQILTINDFLATNKIIACTMLFRNIGFQLPQSFHQLMFGDWFMSVFLMHNSGLKIYNSMELFSAYRVHSTGVMNSLSILKSYNAHVLQIVSIHDYIETNYSEHIKLILSDYYIRKYRIEICENNFRDALKTVISHFKILNFRIPFREYLGIIKGKFLSNK